MEALREIIAGSRLAEIIDLPETFKTSELEVIILPLEKKNKKKSTEKTEKKRPISFNLEDLQKPKMGKELSKLDKAKSRQKLITLMEKGIYTLPNDFTFVREDLYD